MGPAALRLQPQRLRLALPSRDWHARDNFSNKCRARAGGGYSEPVSCGVVSCGHLEGIWDWGHPAALRVVLCLSVATRRRPSCGQTPDGVSLGGLPAIAHALLAKRERRLARPAGLGQLLSRGNDIIFRHNNSPALEATLVRFERLTLAATTVRACPVAIIRGLATGLAAPAARPRPLVACRASD